MKFLYNFDIIGPNPKLYIFKSEKYKTLFSLILSFIIIFISIIFILYSLVIYFKFDKPVVSYTKSNDLHEERKIFLKDTLIMFQYIDFINSQKINESIADYRAEYRATFDNGTMINVELKVEKCKLGKNLDSKYAQYFKEKIDGVSIDDNLISNNGIDDFYCISSDDTDLSLFYLPEIGYNSISLYFILKNQSVYIPENINFMLVYENNLFNHNNRNNPISEGISYQFIVDFSSYEYTSIDFNFQYFNYETDDGLFFDTSKHLYGMSFLDMLYNKGGKLNYNIEKDFKEKSYSNFGDITFKLNKSNYDYYRRSYKKLQTLVAEIMSIVSLLFEIGKIISGFLNEKKMSIDIIKKLVILNNPKKSRNIQIERIKITPTRDNNSLIINENINQNLKLSNDDESKTIHENKHEKVLKSINIFNIIKSFIFKSNKDKLINLCHDIIIEDMCIENILEKFYNLGRIYRAILKEEKYNLGLYKEPKFREINSIIYTIYNECKKNDK